MGRKYYSSGVKASDIDEARPSNLDAPEPLQQSLGPLLADDTTRAKAAVNVRRLCPDDAEEMLAALGLTTAELEDSPACPVCGAAPGKQCTSERQRVLSKWHVARKRLAGKAVLR